MFESELVNAASQFIIGLNGTADDYKVVRSMAGPATVILHSEGSASEMPTLGLLDDWSRRHPGWCVLYLHTKGVTWPNGKPGAEGRHAWRRCMMKHLVTNWAQCVMDLSNGCDMVGCHWLSKHRYRQYAEMLPNPIWGGNFWWSTSDYLARLPRLQPKRGWEQRYDAEMWPVSGQRMPRIVDYAPHWPGNEECNHEANNEKPT